MHLCMAKCGCCPIKPEQTPEVIASCSHFQRVFAEDIYAVCVPTCSSSSSPEHGPELFTLLRLWLNHYYMWATSVFTAVMPANPSQHLYQSLHLQPSQCIDTIHGTMSVAALNHHHTMTTIYHPMSHGAATLSLGAQPYSLQPQPPQSHHGFGRLCRGWYTDAGRVTGTDSVYIVAGCQPRWTWFVSCP